MIAAMPRLIGAVMRRLLARSMVLQHGTIPRDPVAHGNRDAGQLYVHVPFCPSLCPFCTFHRVRFQRERATPYFAALHREIDRYHDAGFAFQDLYVGGGTPTVMADELGALIAHARNRFALRHVAVETNPSHLTEPIMNALVAAGVDRLSVGVQTFDDVLLERMGRRVYGTSAEIVAALTGAAGRFKTLNADFMFNLPGQTDGMIDRDLATVLDIPAVNQATFYPLMTTRGSQIALRARMGSSPNREHAQYERIRRAMTARMRHSSIWCFSIEPDSIDEYMAYHDDYAGVGSGAFGYLGGRLYSNTFSIKRYVDRVVAGRPAVTGTRMLSERERMRFDLLIKLFGLTLDKHAIEAKYQGRFRTTLWKEIGAFKAIGAIEESTTHLRLTEPGLYAWVVMMREFLSSLNALREDMRAHLEAERQQDREPIRLVAPTMPNA